MNKEESRFSGRMAKRHRTRVSAIPEVEESDEVIRVSRSIVSVVEVSNTIALLNQPADSVLPDRSLSRI
jgi:hypothetical protein